MDGNKVNILFVCGCGMGTSTMMELNIKKALQPHGIRANLQHTSLGQMESLRSWADIIVILKNLAKELKVREGEHVIEVVNITDGRGICAKLNEIVDANFPGAKG